MDNRKRVVIVVPLYKLEISPLENISLIQLYRVLGSYPICYIAPEKLRNELKETALWIEYFSDASFQNVAEYSRLCLNPVFYRRFSQYEYMLLYQTDVFVFSDRLLEFCDAGYDYIGAIWPRLWAKEDKLPCQYRVGNGGFSLRNIQAALRVLAHRDKILSAYGNWEHMLGCEDLFWAFTSSLPDEKFVTPPPVYAMKFSLQTYNDTLMRNLTEDRLPFGCHGWTKYKCYPLWKRWVAFCGYENLPPVGYIKPSHTIRYDRIKDIRNCLWKDFKKRWQDKRKMFSSGKNIRNMFRQYVSSVYFYSEMYCIAPWCKVACSKIQCLSHGASRMKKDCL